MNASQVRRRDWLDSLEYPVPCVYCGRRLGPDNITVDHLVPRSKGGIDGPKNFVPACRRCNLGKRDNVLDQTRAMLAKARLRGHRHSPLKLGVKPQKKPRGLREIGGFDDDFEG